MDDSYFPAQRAIEQAEYIKKLEAENAALRAGGAGRIGAERRRQLEVEGWGASHDKYHHDDELALAAACYALPQRERYGEAQSWDGIPLCWPWKDEWWKPTPANRIRELEKAGALIAAEIDRLLALGGAS